MDVGFVGNPFTWSNGRYGREAIFERLDRGVANGDWRVLLPRATIKHLLRVASDHAPLLLNTVGEQNSEPKPFCFEPFWTRDTSCAAVIEKAWAFHYGGSPTFVFCKCLTATREALCSWNKDVFGCIQPKIQHLRLELDALQCHLGGDNLGWEQKEIRGQLLEELKRE